jgi:group II intron reverse transcriptase/maturase
MSSEGPDRKVDATPGARGGPEPLESVISRVRRIEQVAREHPTGAITALNHHLDLNLLCAAYQELRKDAAVGVDGQSVADYGEHLMDNLRDLQNRAKSGRYQAPPVRRVHIPKNEKETRPIGVPTTEDKILQRAVSTILTPIYELEFQPFSFGFRPGKTAHQAIRYLREQCQGQKVEWILEVDLRRFFDTVNQARMRELLGRRVSDGVINRLVAKWLRAGVMEKGQLSIPEEGTPQGGVISPLLANIYLHEVLDQWFVRQVQPQLVGRSFMVRFADDFVMGFSEQKDAQAMIGELDKRFAEFGLKINADKTRLVPFKRPVPPKWKQEELAGVKPGTFDFLGFTFYWGKTRLGGHCVKVKTSKKRFTRTLDRMRDWCRQNRHEPVAWQCAKLNEKLRGHGAYYGVSFNSTMLGKLHYEVTRIWFTWLRRRGQKRLMNWQRFHAILTVRPLVQLKCIHRLY